jgi:hypothetical protein
VCVVYRRAFIQIIRRTQRHRLVDRHLARFYAIQKTNLRVLNFGFRLQTLADASAAGS